MIEVTCGSCGRVLQIDDKFAGSRGSCNHCKAPLLVPVSNDPNAIDVDLALSDAFMKRSPVSDEAIVAAGKVDEATVKRRSNVAAAGCLFVIILVPVLMMRSACNDSKSAEWHYVTQWSGTESKTTEVFTIPGDEWTLTWKAEGEPLDGLVGVFVGRIYRSDGSEVGPFGFLSADTKTLYLRGRGEYYIDVIANMRWGITIGAKYREDEQSSSTTRATQAAPTPVTVTPLWREPEPRPVQQYDEPSPVYTPPAQPRDQQPVYQQPTDSIIAVVGDSKIFHEPSCHYVRNAKNAVVTDYRSKAMQLGYTPCKVCKP